MLENEKDITDLHLGKRGTLYSAVFNNVHSYNNFVRLKFCHMKILMITLFYSYQLSTGQVLISIKIDGYIDYLKQERCILDYIKVDFHVGPEQ